MTISVWRYSHLALAVSSFILLILASVTGIILAFQPIVEKMQPYEAKSFSEITLAQSLPNLRKTYPGITELSVDANRFVQVKGSDAEGNKLLAYVDPLTGKILGTPKPVSEFFQWTTALHRSLFIHETGRFFIGLTSFLLLLTTVSGTMLIIQRQRGVKRFFARIARDNFAQYYHVVLGRLSLIPILIIALTGTYLSLARFNFFDVAKVAPKIDFDAIKSEPVRSPASFEVFSNTKLSDVESVEFPFSEDVEDYYTLKLKAREVTVNQVTGDVLTEVKYPSAVLLTNLSLTLHTGRGSTIWAIVLAIASANILFFIYSGFAMTFKRWSNRAKNKFKAEESEYIILVGSENGSTFGFGRAVQQALIKAGKKAYLTELNNYTLFPMAKQLIVMTATYGLGDAPTNASKMAALLKKYPQQQALPYSIVGFGSHAYPDFCKFAYEAGQLLSSEPWATQSTDIYTINDRSATEFGLWAEAWTQQAGLVLDISSGIPHTNLKSLKRFTVTSNTATTQNDGTFSVKLKVPITSKVTSGDLLAIYPANDQRERLYSIGVVAKEIRLSVRLQPGGLGSGFLHRLTPGQNIRARIVSNPHFHFPQQATQVVMIANGTGIAPFLGMISENKSKTSIFLYCGFRAQSAYTPYQELLEESLANGRLKTINTAFSRENERQYVNQLIGRDADFIAKLLGSKGVLMICGSLAMEKDVMALLETICQAQMGKSVSHFRSHNQILTDCY
jgi:sulfite reductase (NADPH) flavoprotein alpha-component